MTLCYVVIAFVLSISLLVADDQDLASNLAEKCKKITPLVVKSTEEYKTAIQEVQSQIAKKPTAELYLTLALLQLKDQQEEEAFKSYIQCLEKLPIKQTAMSSSEKAKFDELFSLYVANSDELQGRVETVLKQNPHYLHCQFLLAAQTANERRYEPFFYLFYQSYSHYPESHMAYKTKGVIASLILQRVRTIEEKKQWRAHALASFKRAMNICPEDLGLHRMYMFTASDKERKEAVQTVFKVVLEKDIKMPRQEIPLYIQHALAVDELDSAQRLLDKAKTWYEYSRILQEMQELLEQRKAEIAR